MYRGKTVEELQNLSLKELAELLPSYQRRRINKGFTEDQKKLIKKIKENQRNIKTHCRTMPVIPLMFNKTIGVYAGKEYLQVLVQPEMIGHVLGEFALTRKKVGHSAPGIGATRSSSNVSVK